MNRSNVGNVVTNGMQILSVAGTTASKAFKRQKDDVSTSLNAKPEQNTPSSQVSGNNNTNNQNTSDNNQKPEYTSPQSNIIETEAPVVVYEFEDIKLIENSEQVPQISQRVKNDVEISKRYSKRYKQGVTVNGKSMGGKFLPSGKGGK